MNKLQDVIGSYDSFLKIILSQVEDAGFDLNDFVQLDHICYRTASLDSYEFVTRSMPEHAKLIMESEVNGRRISVFRLKKPIFYGAWRINLIEIPAPKEGSPYPDGLEHIEFVLHDDIPTFIEKYSGKEFNLEAIDRIVNPEISFKLDGGFSVKFHTLSLATVLLLESKLKMIG